MTTEPRQMMLNPKWVAQELWDQAGQADDRGEHESAARFRGLANKIARWESHQRYPNAIWRRRDH